MMFPYRLLVSFDILSVRIVTVSILLSRPLSYVYINVDLTHIFQSVYDAMDFPLSLKAMPHCPWMGEYVWWLLRRLFWRFQNPGFGGSSYFFDFDLIILVLDSSAPVLDGFRYVSIPVVTVCPHWSIALLAGSLMSSSSGWLFDLFWSCYLWDGIVSSQNFLHLTIFLCGCGQTSLRESIYRYISVSTYYYI